MWVKGTITGMEEGIIENQPELKQTPVAVEKKKINPLTIVILLIVILLVGVGGVYAGMQLGKEQTPTSIPTQVAQPTLSVVIPTTSASTEITDWKIAIDNEDKGSFKYPKDWYYSNGILASYDIVNYDKPVYPAGSTKCDIFAFDPKTVILSDKKLFFENEIKVFKAQGKYEPDDMNLGNSDVFLIEDGRHSSLLFYCYSYNF